MKRAFAQVLTAPIDLYDDASSKEDYAVFLKHFAVELAQPASSSAHNSPSAVSLQFSPPALRAQILERLNSLETKISLDPTLAQESLTWIGDVLKQETSSALLRKAIALMGQLCLHPFVEPTLFIADILNSSHFKSVLVACGELIPVLLKTLTSIMTAKSGSVTSIEKLAQSALIGLPTPSCRVEALVTLAKFDLQGSKSFSNGILFRYLEDSDFRVRSAAFRLMREWILKYCIIQHKSMPKMLPIGIDRDSDLDEMTLELYKKSVIALTDDSDDVQREALRNIWFLANIHPQKLADDAFRKICNMVSDASVEVRALACGLLGTLHGVTPKLLLQSLSKNLLKVGASSVDGKATWKEDPFDPGAGQESVEVVSKLSTQSRLIESGANGAFVHGLEDEFKGVRDAALASMCELAHGSKNFALKSTEFFVDMFNDEIDTVRVHALQSVSKIGQLIFLSEDQLLVVLAMLDDATFTVRLSTRKLLSSIRLMDAHSLLTAVNAIQSSLTKHFTERDTILPSFAALGKNHPHFVELLFEELFKIDTRFVMREPRLDTISYVSIAILLLNAAKENANLIEWLPPFIHRHYLYLKRRHPLLVPDVPSLDSTTRSDGTGQSLSHSSTLKAQQITERVLSGGVSSSSPSLSSLWGSSSFQSTPGFSESQVLTGYASSRHLFGTDSKTANDSVVDLDSILSRLESAISSLKSFASLEDSSLNDFLALLESLKQDLSSNCEFKFGQTEQLFYVAYFEMLEALFSPLVLSDLSQRRNCGQRIFFLKSMFMGLPISVQHNLNHISDHWNKILLSSDSLAKLESMHPIWDALRKPIHIPHMLKRVTASIFFPSSDPASIRDFPGSLPLCIQILAEVTSDSLSDLSIIISCETVHLKMAVPLAASHFTKIRPLRYSINLNASIPPQKWEHNKIVHLRLSICRTGPNFELDLSQPISVPIRAKLR